jgi:hypothetical protein
MSSYTAKMNRLKLNVVKDHPKTINGSTVMERKVAANKSGSSNDSSLGPRVINNFSLMKRRIGCCDEMYKNTQTQTVVSSERTISLGDKLFSSCDETCATTTSYSSGCGDKCNTVKTAPVAQDYLERIRRLKADADKK